MEQMEGEGRVPGLVMAGAGFVVTIASNLTWISLKVSRAPQLDTSFPGTDFLLGNVVLVCGMAIVLTGMIVWLLPGRRGRLAAIIGLSAAAIALIATIILISTKDSQVASRVDEGTRTSFREVAAVDLSAGRLSAAKKSGALEIPLGMGIYLAAAGALVAGLSAGRASMIKPSVDELPLRPRRGTESALPEDSAENFGFGPSRSAPGEATPPPPPPPELPVAPGGPAIPPPPLSDAGAGAAAAWAEPPPPPGSAG